MGIKKGQRKKGDREKKEKKTTKLKHVLFGLRVQEQEFRVYIPIFSLIWGEKNGGFEEKKLKLIY